MTTTENTHPLLAKPLEIVDRWPRWMTLWKQAMSAAERLGLLHLVFDVRSANDAEDRDRLLFLLAVADGYQMEEWAWQRFIAPAAEEGSWDWPLQEATIKAAPLVAKKAFTVLCDRYFKPRRGGHDRESVSALSGLSVPLLEKLLWFFRDQARREYFPNLPSERDTSHQAGIAREYVLQLIREAWTPDDTRLREREGRGIGDETKAACVRARMHYVCILHELRALHILWEYNTLRDIDEVSLAALRHLAFYVQREQKYASAQQAVFTYAGRQLLVLEAMIAEKARLQRIAEAERLQRQAALDLADAQRG